MTEENQQPKEYNTEERNMVTLCVLGSIIFAFIPSLIVWLLKKDTFSEYALTALKRNLNFQIVIYAIMVILSIIPIINFFGIILIPVLWVFSLIVCICAYQAIDKQRDYNYPISVQIIK